MKFKDLMIIKALVCVGFGPILLFFPGPFLTLLGTSFEGGAALTARLYAATLFGNSVLAWYARSAEKSVARRAIMLDLFVYDGIALVVTLIIQLSGGLNTLGWGVVFIYLFFTVGYGYFLFAGGESLPQEKPGS